MSLAERLAEEASPALQQRLKEIDGRAWMELAGVVVGVVGWDAWLLGADGIWKKAPRPVEELQAALQAAGAERQGEASIEGRWGGHAGAQTEAQTDELLDELMRLFEYATEAKVTRTAKDLEYLTEDQPGPEVIRSGQIGERGLARWAAPGVEGGALRFYANVPREDRTANFVCVRVALDTRELSVEVVDGGWFEIAAYLGP